MQYGDRKSALSIKSATKHCRLSHVSRRMSLSQGGFTLVETIVALALIMMALVGPVSLIVRGIYSFSSSKSKITAVNLAQEGIELVRLIRENNIACDFANGPANWNWTRNPDGGSIPSQAEVDVQQSFLPVTCGSASIRFPRLANSCSRVLLYNASAGTYGYQTGTPTTFSRCIEINSPPSGGRDTDIPPNDQMDVIATVTWEERGRTRTLVLRERLYHWE